MSRQPATAQKVAGASITRLRTTSLPSELRKAGPTVSLSSATSRPEGHTTATQTMARRMTAATRAIRS